MRNCLSYALCMWAKYGGYLLIRRSKLAEELGITSKWHPLYWIPHFLHRDKDFNITQYTATQEQREKNKLKGKVYTGLSLWHFNGEVKGDDK